MRAKSASSTPGKQHRKKSGIFLVSEEVQCEVDDLKHPKRPPLPIPGKSKMSQNNDFDQTEEKSNKKKRENQRKPLKREVTENDIIDVIIEYEILPFLPIEEVNRKILYKDQVAANNNVKKLIEKQNGITGKPMISTSTSSDDEQTFRKYNMRRKANVPRPPSQGFYKARDSSSINAILSIDEIARYNNSDSYSNDIEENLYYASPDDVIDDVDELLAFEIIEPFKFDLLDFSDPVSKKTNIQMRPKIR